MILFTFFLVSKRAMKRVMAKPMDHLPAMEKALRSILETSDPEFVKRKELESDFHVGFDGSFGAHAVNPRTLSARFLGSLVCVEGIVTKCMVSLKLKFPALSLESYTFVFFFFF